MTLEIAQSTPTAAAIAGFVRKHYDLGEVTGGEFLRRSFNQVYRLDFADRRRAVARLCSERPRGVPNLRFEAGALDHLARCAIPVSRCLPAADGNGAVDVPLPEGPRPLAVFEYVAGEATGNATEDIATFARGLAALHDAGARYDGPPSLYTLDLDYLLLRPLERLLRKWQAFELPQ